MTDSDESMKVDVDLARGRARRLAAAAEDLAAERSAIRHSLAHGGDRPVAKRRGDVAVAIGTAPYSHPGTTAGEIIADRMESCMDGYVATEEGLRALGVVMERITSAIEERAEIDRDRLDAAVADLHCVVRVVDGRADAPADWFGMRGTP